MILIKSIFRNKKNYIYILLTSLIIVLLIVCNMFFEYYSYLLNETVGAKRENRTLEVLNVNKEYQKELTENPEIEKIYANYLINGTINKCEVKIASFNEINEPKNENEIIINKMFAADNNYEIGKEITIEILGAKINLKIAKLTNNDYSRVYINQRIIDSIANTNELEPKSYIVVIKKYKNVKKWLEILNKKGFIAYMENSAGEQEIGELNKIRKISNYCIIIFVIIGAVLIYLISESLDLEDKNNIYLLKILGFKNNNINMYTFIKKSIILVLSTIIALIISVIISLIVLKLIPNINWFNYKFIRKEFIILVTIFGIIVNSIVSYKNIEIKHIK